VSGAIKWRNVGGLAEILRIWRAREGAALASELVLHLPTRTGEPQYDWRLSVQAHGRGDWYMHEGFLHGIGWRSPIFVRPPSARTVTRAGYFGGLRDCELPGYPILQPCLVIFGRYGYQKMQVSWAVRLWDIVVLERQVRVPQIR
jgi:hypothetical protein